MDAKIARRRIYERPAKKIGFDQVPSSQVCRFWKQGKCNRNPCRFIHSEIGYVISEAPWVFVGLENDVKM